MDKINSLLKEIRKENPDLSNEQLIQKIISQQEGLSFTRGNFPNLETGQPATVDSDEFTPPEQFNKRTGGFILTRKGLDIVTRVQEPGNALKITKVAVGSGRVMTDERLIDLQYITELRQEVAPAVMTEPVFQEGTHQLEFVVEYHNKLEGASQTGFWLSEIGIWAKVIDEEVGETDENDIGDLMSFGSLLDYPIWVHPPSLRFGEIRKFPVSIGFNNTPNVWVSFPLKAFVTHEELEEERRRFRQHELLTPFSRTNGVHGIKIDDDGRMWVRDDGGRWWRDRGDGLFTAGGGDEPVLRPGEVPENILQRRLDDVEERIRRHISRIVTNTGVMGLSVDFEASSTGNVIIDRINYLYDLVDRHIRHLVTSQPRPFLAFSDYMSIQGTSEHVIHRQIDELESYANEHMSRLVVSPGIM